MVSVQLNEVYRSLVSSDVLTVIVGKEYFRDVVDRLHEETDGELLISDYVNVPCLDDEGL